MCARRCKRCRSRPTATTRAHRAIDAARWFRRSIANPWRAGDAGAADGMQAGSIQALRYRDDPAGILRGFGLKVGPRRRQSALRDGSRNASQATQPWSHRKCAALGACGFAARVRHVRETCAGNGAARQARAADNVGAGRRADRGADSRFGDRRSVAIFVLEVGRAAFRSDAEKILVVPAVERSGNTSITRAVPNPRRWSHRWIRILYTRSYSSAPPVAPPVS